MGILSDITAKASSPKPGTLTYKLLTKAAGGHVRIYRATGGRILGRAENAPMLLLEHVGRKSGRRRTTPLVYVRDAADVLVIASMGGSPKHPAWFLNLREMDETQIQIGSRRERVRPEILSDEDKRTHWPRIVQTWPAYQAYQDRTDREIPVVRLKPLQGRSAG
jgi:deazaflavin-dependent oxidoreductase (nitroreductase family)